jgi:hypothetical protein
MRARQDDLERILGRLDIADCWEWTGATLQGGYGKSHAGSHKEGTYRTVLVHRFVYLALTQQTIDGLDLDHLCKNRKCANPDHLEPVTRGENIRRGATGRVPAWNRSHPRPARRKTHCLRGHDKSDAIVRPNGARACRTCHRIASLRRYYEQKAVTTDAD